jgi:hypothetical protein
MRVNSWHFWNWGEGVPKDEIQRIIAAKEFALTSELVNIIISPQLHVLQLDRIEMNPGEQRTSDYKPPTGGERTEQRVEPYFDVYPFVLEVRMPVERYEILLRELLHSSKDIAIYVRNVSMARIDDDPKIMRQMRKRRAQGIANLSGFYPYTEHSAKAWEETWVDFTFDLRKLIKKHEHRLRRKTGE